MADRHAASGLYLFTLLCAAQTIATTISTESTRQDAFINYREVSRKNEDWDPDVIAAVALVSSYGQIRLRLRRDWAPEACDQVARVAAAASLRACNGCTFYRHEPAPPNWGVNGFYGPPYGLLQGGMPNLASAVKFENTARRAVRRGSAAFIAGSTDFFIGTVDHSEWGGAFTVFAQAEVEDLVSVVPLVPMEPYRNSTDQYNFTTRWLLDRKPYSLRPLRLEDLMTSSATAAAGRSTDDTAGLLATTADEEASL
ncbi:hypothetical protein Agub_g7338 [Astrephomene gubernaculifera]|uniref:Peptidylprolyl isomerase n=1 Tax=Astrephomene gubernaculifera TaxID=47775 RepID=A0AAD3DPY4_9CHLO|nr:hypothetical protein Agub_g7338 [Astrephomene gubernaculifera]